MSPERLQSTPDDFEVKYHETSNRGRQARELAEAKLAAPVAKPKAGKRPQKGRGEALAPPQVKSVRPKIERPAKANLAGSSKPLSNGLGSRLNARRPVSA
jgi:hypothetical protein